MTMSKEKIRILVVDDEEPICEVLKFNLEREGYKVDTCTSAEQALTLDIRDYSLILLDIMMGEMSGLGMARILRHRDDTKNIPIIFCSAKGREEDIVSGLDIGADDYIPKPFSLNEVLARVRSVLRRSMNSFSKSEDAAERIETGPFVLDLNMKKCFVDGEGVILTKTEYEILKLLLSKPGVVFSREDILAKVWGPGVVVLDRTIDVNITRLRKKLGKYGYKLATRSGYGYTFEP